jgi:FAS-associated factor 2
MVLAPLRWMFQTRPVNVNRELDARKFLAEFDAQYGRLHPTFVDGSYQLAVQRAFQQSKFLLVYIHSPMHEDTPRFCHQVLCTQTFAQFANEHFVCWSGRVWDPEAYDLSNQLRAASFPFLALLVCQSDRVVQVAERTQGFVDERALVDKLRTNMLMFDEVLTRTRTEATRREESAMLREQQDREYRESAEADRRERLRREEEQAARAREAEEARQRREQEEAAAQSERNARELHIKKIRESLLEEPQPAADVATVRFQLPQGTKLARRFHREHSAQMIYDYLTLYFADNGVAVTNFVVSTHFPKQNLEDMSATVQDLGLHPRGMLYVQDLDA